MLILHEDLAWRVLFETQWEKGDKFPAVRNVIFAYSNPNLAHLAHLAQKAQNRFFSRIFLQLFAAFANFANAKK